MADKYDGGPAYPGEHLDRAAMETLRQHRDLFSAQDCNALARKHPGMSLRDRFALQIMPALYRDNDHRSLAEEAYRYADAMLAQREQ